MNNKIIFPILFALVLLVPGSALASTTDFKVFVTSTTTHELGLKATQMGNGQVIPISNFAISPESVVQINQGKNLMVFTSTNEPDRIQKVKVTNAQGQVTELLSLQNNQYSLSNLNVGVYTLNVIVDSPDTSSLNAFETLLIVLAPDQQPIEKTEITKIIQKTKVFVEIIFEEEEECRPGYFYNEKTGNCEKINVCTTGILHEDKGCTPLPRPPEPCTPDGGECPPCPEDVEASWCMDEDERQDTDDGLSENVPPTDDETEDEDDGPVNFGGEGSSEEGNGNGNEEDGESESEGQDDEVDFGADEQGGGN